MPYPASLRRSPENVPWRHTRRPFGFGFGFGRIVLSLVIMGVGSLSTVANVTASQTISPWYTHSWYITDTGVGRIQNIGGSDGDWDSTYPHCTPGSGDNLGQNKITILDFGRPVNVSGDGTPYYGYGTVFLDSSLLVRDDTIVYLAEQYALQYWYHSQGACQQLRLMLGTNNSYLCQQPPGYTQYTCDPGRAGSAWGDAVYQVQLWLQTNGLTSRINAEAADDAETSGSEWSCFGDSRAFLDGFNGNNPVHARMADFGDAITAPYCWAIQDVYYAAYGQSAYRPLPEMYGPANGLCYWTTGSCRGYGVESSVGAMEMLGEMTECQENDPVPYGPCSSGEWGPGEAWDNLWNTQQQNYPGVQPTMDYATNIKREP